jgi:hypothetical protein
MGIFNFWNMAFIGTFQLSLSQIPEETEEILQHIINSNNNANDMRVTQDFNSFGEIV